MTSQEKQSSGCGCSSILLLAALVLIVLTLAPPTYYNIPAPPPIYATRIIEITIRPDPCAALVDDRIHISRESLAARFEQRPKPISPPGENDDASLSPADLDETADHGPSPLAEFEEELSSALNASGWKPIEEQEGILRFQRTQRVLPINQKLFATTPLPIDFPKLPSRLASDDSSVVRLRDPDSVLTTNVSGDRQSKMSPLSQYDERKLKSGNEVLDSVVLSVEGLTAAHNTQPWKAIAWIVGFLAGAGGAIWAVVKFVWPYLVKRWQQRTARLADEKRQRDQQQVADARDEFVKEVELKDPLNLPNIPGHPPK